MQICSVNTIAVAVIFLLSHILSQREKQATCFCAVPSSVLRYVAEIIAASWFVGMRTINGS